MKYHKDIFFRWMHRVSLMVMMLIIGASAMMAQKIKVACMGNIVKFKNSSAKGQPALEQQRPADIRLLHYQPLAQTNNATWDKTTLHIINDQNDEHFQ